MPAAQPPESSPGENESMLLTSPLASDTSRCAEIFAGLDLDRSFVVGATVVRNVPVRLLATGIDQQRIQQHYQTLTVEGPVEAIPGELVIDAQSIASGGRINVDSVALPPECEVIGVWFTNPLVTVAADTQ